MTPSPASKLFHVVVLAGDRPEHGLSQRHVGTLGEGRPAGVGLVEFSDDAGRTCAILNASEKALLPLRFSVPDIA